MGFEKRARRRPLDEWPGDEEDLQHRRMEVLTSIPLYAGPRGGQKMALQDFRVLDAAMPRELYDAARARAYRHCSSSARSSTSNTLPSPSSVEPAIPARPERIPSKGFSMTAMRSPTRCTASAPTS